MCIKVESPSLGVDWNEIRIGILEWCMFGAGVRFFSYWDSILGIRGRSIPCFLCSISALCHATINFYILSHLHTRVCNLSSLPFFILWNNPPGKQKLHLDIFFFLGRGSSVLISRHSFLIDFLDHVLHLCHSCGLILKMKNSSEWVSVRLAVFVGWSRSDEISQIPGNSFRNFIEIPKCPFWLIYLTCSKFFLCSCLLYLMQSLFLSCFVRLIIRPWPHLVPLFLGHLL